MPKLNAALPYNSKGRRNILLLIYGPNSKRFGYVFKATQNVET